MRLPLLAVYLAAVCNFIVSAQTAPKPVAYVYVQEGGPGLYMPVYAYAASSEGKLTPIKGSPFTQVDDTGMMLATNGSHFIFIGQGPNPSGDVPYNYLYSYDVSSSGAIGSQVSVINTGVYSSNSSCSSLKGAEMDHTGQYIYADTCDDEIETYKIDKSSGALNFQDATPEDVSTNPQGYPKLTGNSAYGYNLNMDKLPSSFGPNAYTTGLDVFKRQSDGSLEFGGEAKVTWPSLPNNYYASFSNESFNPFLEYTLGPIAEISNDQSNHFAAELGIEQFIPPDTYKNQGCSFASFTVGSNGQVTSTNTYEDMPQGDCGTEMLLSPDGKVLAVNNTANLDFLHFNGADPMTRFASVGKLAGFYTTAWDKAGHLYALSGIDGKLHVYAVNSNSVNEAPGSPYDIPFCGLDENGQSQCPQTLIVRINP